MQKVSEQPITGRIVPFFGNGPYCYSNATSMLLSSVGEQIPPSEIEAYTGVGLGAFWLPKQKLLFFSNISNPPDKGISRALQLLGFEFRETATDNPETPPYGQLKSDLSTSPAILGPLDMGYLTHNPLHKRMAGADHFVLAYDMDDDGVSIHDPEGFPSVHLPFRQLELAWRAESIGYRRGYYRYWTSLKHVQHPDGDQLYHSALKSFKDIYSAGEKLASANKWTIDRDAILTQARHIKNDKVSPAERGFMVHFAFKLGARRALDFASFFSRRNVRLAELKRTQAELFGRCQVQAAQRSWANVSNSLHDLADVEKEFRDALMPV
jgi:hypothetical protein